MLTLKHIPRFIKFATYKIDSSSEKRGIIPRFSGNKCYRFYETRYRCRKPIITLLLFLISSFAFQTSVTANNKEQLAQQYYAQGFAEQQKGNLVEALDLYAQAILLVPKNAAVLNDAAVAYEQLDLPSKAESYYHEAIEADGKYLPPYMNLGYFYLKFGYVGRAFEYFKTRYELGGRDDPWALKAKEEMLKINPEYNRITLNEEIENLNEELAAYGNNEFYNRIVLAQQAFIQGQQWQTKGQLGKAVEEFDKALIYTPHNPKILKARQEVIDNLRTNKDAEFEPQVGESVDSKDLLSANMELQRKLTTFPDEYFISK